MHVFLISLFSAVIPEVVVCLLTRDTMQEYHLQRGTLFACEGNLKTLTAVVFLESRTRFALQAHELLDTLRLRPRCIYSQSITLSRDTIFHNPTKIMNTRIPSHE
eukprot:sb/3477967/